MDFISSGRLGLLVVLAVLAGCGFPKTGAAPGPVSPAAVRVAQAKWPDSSAESLSAGRDLFIAGCNGCHGYPELEATPEAQWPGTMKRMGPQSGFDEAQTERVLRFVLAARGAR
ncbi:hypothetical protein [Sorangium sp. So ce124]|uniref:hypothetical protein n=1 Tax=Sorangium sp. So ce124 TaxID=3133280 RepID=UPI003F62FE0D